MSKRKKSPPLITRLGVDEEVNAVFTALSHTVGVSPLYTAAARPFKAGGSRNVRSIVQSWSPQLYDFSPLDADDFYKPYSLSHFFDRYFYADEVDNSKNLKAEAKEKFLGDVERGWLYNAVIPLFDKPWFTSVMEEAGLIMQAVLGEFVESEVFERCGHGPNSTVTLQLKDAFLDRKVLDLSGTRGACEAFGRYLRWDSSLSDELARLNQIPNGVGLLPPRVVYGNALSFVPKKWNKLRTMSKEGTLNVFLHLGTGRLMSDRLKRFANIDISTQPDCHRRLVRVMSLFPECGDATLDWSSASDRLWIALYERWLPPEWFNWLMQIRSPCTVLENGQIVDLPMIGTMGNGFTFPLQTLTFYAIMRAVARVEGVREIGISAFGDDCICPVELVDGIRRFADLVGWELNTEKSFWDGGFRESCGLDAYRGEDVRPFMIERPDDTRSKNALKAWSYVVYNGIQRSLRGRFTGQGFDPTPVDHDPAWTPLVWDWLVGFHKTYELGKVLLVPPRFSDASGVRVGMQVLLRLGYVTKHHIPGPMYEEDVIIPSQDSDGLWHFRFLRNSPSKRKVPWQWPWFHVWMSGNPLPVEWKQVVLDSAECADGSANGIDESRLGKDGKITPAKYPFEFVSRKETNYVSTKGHVLTWRYWDE